MSRTLQVEVLGVTEIVGFGGGGGGSGGSGGFLCG